MFYENSLNKCHATSTLNFTTHRVESIYGKNVAAVVVTYGRRSSVLAHMEVAIVAAPLRSIRRISISHVDYLQYLLLHDNNNCRSIVETS